MCSFVRNAAASRISTPAVDTPTHRDRLAVKKQSEGRVEQEHALRFRPARNVRHRFRLHRMEQEQQRARDGEDRSKPTFHARPVEDPGQNEPHHQRGCEVEENIDDLVAERIGRTGLVIHPVREHEHRPHACEPLPERCGANLRVQERQIAVVE